MQGLVVIVGDAPFDETAVHNVVREYRWSMQRVRDVQALQRLHEQANIVAVLFKPGESPISQQDTIRAVRAAAPGAKPIVCSGFADRTPWPAMAAAGAFHYLRVPFAEPEVRQSLGFVWACQEPAKPAVRLDRQAAKAVA